MIHIEKSKKHIDKFWIVMIVVFILIAIIGLDGAFDKPIIIKDFLLPISMINLSIILYIAKIKKITLESANIVQKIFLIFLIAVQLLMAIFVTLPS